MSDQEILLQRFEAQRAQLRGVAYRMLGSLSEAEDAVQEAWLRLSRAGADGVDNLGGWLTTVVGRVCLDMLRSRKSRREDPIEDGEPEPAAGHRVPPDPEQEALLADSIGLAMLVVLQTLAPAERVAFVLHDMFDLTFDEIGPIVGRSAVATRQLASRARRRVRGTGAAPEADRNRQRGIVEAFLAAARGGDLGGLLAVLDPDVVLRPDTAAIRAGASGDVRGAVPIAGFFSGKAQEARAALVDGAVGAVVAPGGRLLLVLGFTIRGGRIVEIRVTADPESLGRIDLAVLD
ncbi:MULTISPECIES: sigma-70 family RNA polymerase sigma factor [unclassified Inquilinus]|uniref:sigma-70 family RNA polymerase sigma factor n=1 Tax=unclassified Inquilinus TaxID=2645927 RepID=UPI003F9306C4